MDKEAHQKIAELEGGLLEGLKKDLVTLNKARKAREEQTDSYKNQVLNELEYDETPDEGNWL